MSAGEAVRRAVTLLERREGGSLQGELQSLGGKGPQVQRVTAWVHGTLRHRRTLGAVLGAVARRALKGKGARAGAALELFAWRLLFGGEPWEELKGELRQLGESKRVLEHLERVLGALAEAVAGREPWSPAAEGEDDALLPISRTEAVRLRQPLLGVSGRRPAGKLALVHSLPEELVQAWLEAFGPEQAAELCRAANDPPPLFVRTQRLRTTPQALAAALAEEGVATAPTEVPGALALVEGRGRLFASAPWRAGWLSVQDLTAQRVAPLLAPRPGERILDLCAAPGGKTTHLAELADDQGQVLACDLQAARLRRVEENARRLGLTSIRTRRLDGKRAAEDLSEEGPFAGILVDAPCSNTGVLRRRPEARWRYDARSQRRLAREQAALLEAAVGLLAPGGRLVYSVCSIEPEEGPGQVRALLEAQGGLRLTAEERWFPGPGGGDGGYAARLDRRLEGS